MNCEVSKPRRDLAYGANESPVLNGLIPNTYLADHLLRLTRIFFTYVVMPIGLYYYVTFRTILQFTDELIHTSCISEVLQGLFDQNYWSRSVHAHQAVKLIDWHDKRY